jgi:diguanylate cyclase (GGDEF)-like protein/PAS domain S-box-containing protein
MESGDLQLVLVLGAEWIAIAVVIRAVTPGSWVTTLQAASLVVLGLWLPIRLLVVKPLESRARAAGARLRAYEASRGEREMMMGIVEESEARLRAIFNNSPTGVVVLNGTSACPIDFNDTMPRMLGYSRAEFASLPLGRYVVDAGEEIARERIDRALRGSSELFSCRCRTRTGGTFDAQFSAEAVSVGGQPAVSCIVRDISVEREAEHALQLTHDKMQSMISELERRNLERTILTEMGSVLQACVSLDEAFAAISRFGPRLFPTAGGALYVYSHSRSELELAAGWIAPAGGFREIMSPTDCWGLRQGHPYDRTDGSNLTCAHVGGDSEVSYLCVPLTAQGETLGVLHLRAAIPPAVNDGAHDGLTVNRQLVATVCDQITLGLANLRLRETLRQQSILDPLTGLYNRRYMEESLRREIARAIRSGRPLAVIMADLDHFKTFNDTFGHEAGDTVLTEVGLVLKQSVRVSDIACRYGGEEFAFVLPDTTPEGTVKRAEAIRARIADLHVQQRGRNLGGLTVSLGIALLPDHGSTPEDLLRAADVALYRAKQAGRNQAIVAVVDTAAADA